MGRTVETPLAHVYRLTCSNTIKLVKQEHSDHSERPLRENTLLQPNCQRHEGQHSKWWNDWPSSAFLWFFCCTFIFSFFKSFYVIVYYIYFYCYQPKIQSDDRKITIQTNPVVFRTKKENKKYGKLCAIWLNSQICWEILKTFTPENTVPIILTNYTSIFIRQQTVILGKERVELNPT